MYRNNVWRLSSTSSSRAFFVFSHLVLGRWENAQGELCSEKRGGIRVSLRLARVHRQRLTLRGTFLVLR